MPRPVRGHSLSTEAPDAFDYVKHRVTDACGKYSATRDAQNLVKSLVNEKQALLRLPTNERSDAMYRLSLLLKRVEKTCGRHFCGLWNECRTECQYREKPSAWIEDMKLWSPLPDSSPTRTSEPPTISPTHAVSVDQTTLEALLTRLTALETKVSSLECALESATDSLAHERRVRQELESKVDQLERQLHAALTAPASQTRVHTPAPGIHTVAGPPAASEVGDIGKYAFRQALEYGWRLSHGDGLVDEYAPPRAVPRVYVKGPAPTADELTEMQRKQALEHRWIHLHPSHAGQMSEPRSHAPSVPLSSLELRPRAYKSRGPVTAQELKDMARRQAWEDVWAPHDGGFPYTFPLHDVA